MPTTMLKFFIGLFLFLALIGAAYYFVGLPPSTIEEKKVEVQPIAIGFIGPLSGDSASYGAPIKNSIALAVRDLKTQGKKVDVIYEDGKCSGDDARTAFLKLFNENKINIIIGGVCSGETLAIAPLAEEKAVIVFSPSAASPDITNAGTFVFRNNPSDTYGGKVLGELLAQKYKDIAIISDNTEYAQILRKIFLEKYNEGDGEVLVDEVSTPDAKDFKAIISNVKKSKAEAVIINSQTEQTAGTLVKVIRNAKINLPLYGHLLPAGAKFLEVAGKTAEGLTFTDVPALDIDNIRVSAFLEDYRKNYGASSQEFYMGAAYDAVNILVQAVEKAGNDPLKIRDYLYNLPEYDGLIGKYSFDLNGDVVGIDLVLKQIRDGKAEDMLATSTSETLNFRIE